MKFSKSLLNWLLPLLILAVIVLASFGRTLGSYFLEDDFGEVLYVSQIFSGKWHQLVENFTGNYMQIPTMKVYRPCLLLSIMFDYAFWKTNACGYFITNIVFLMAAAMMLYVVLRQMTSSWNLTRSIIFALMSAALFAASPLHCESASLMVGRVDIICSFFYLLALWAFMKKGVALNLKWLVLGLISFWIALLTKEMAVGLPVVATAICFLFPRELSNQPKMKGMFDDDHREENFSQRFKLSLLVTYPLWLSLLLYFVIRRLALGTFTGGYVGSVGASQWRHVLEKWTDPDTISRIIFPFNRAVFGDGNIYHFLLIAIYIALLVLIILRIILLGMPRAWIALFAVWTVTTLLPLYQLWGLGLNLEGSRFLFFLTMPLAIFMPLLVFAPTDMKKNNIGLFDSDNQTKTGLIIVGAATVALLLLVMFDTKVAAKNNIPWVHAGKQTRALLKEGQKLAQSLERGQKAIILGIPKEVAGAHVMYNGITFNFLMTPPFSKEYLADRFLTYDPIFFGNANLINTQRFKEEISRSDVTGCYVWNQDKLAFDLLNNLKEARLTAIRSDVPFIIPLPQEKEIVFPFNKQSGLWEIKNDGINILQPEKGTAVMIAPLNINPLNYDFMEIEAVIAPPRDAEHISTFWQGAGFNDEQFPGQARAISVSSESPVQLLSKTGATTLPLTKYRYRVALSRYWRWFTEGNIGRIGIELPSAHSIIIKNIRILADTHIVPTLRVLDQPADNRGVYSVGKNGFLLQAEAQNVSNCVMIKLEFSKPNYFFENLTGQDSEAILTSMTTSGCIEKNVINSQLFPMSAYYQIRAIALNKEGVSQGEWSDPVTIKYEAAKQ